ncbi:MAG: acyl-CoA dehydrogenase family protein [Mycobacteriaceae bacterium]|uniref:acyl-CoA dehydrogenase family protein n=1 Tax=Corynebacterium sp. TaxID=1720 RepID=UPI003F966D60
MNRAAQVADAVIRLKHSGLLAATVPARLGGPEYPASAIAEAFRILAGGDGSLGQIPQSHMTFSRWLFDGSHPGTEQHWADRLLGGTLIANAQAEREPVILDDGVLNGRKIFCTGSIYADVVVVTARRPGEDTQSLGVFLPVDTPGLRVVDDWSALGQEFTGSGTVEFDNVAVDEQDVRAFDDALTLPGYGVFAQLLHAAIDVGIAGAALDATLELTASADPDPLTAHLAGELVAQRFAAEAVVEKAGRALDDLWEGNADPATVSLQVAAAKVTTGRLTVDLASRIFELTGTRGTAANSDLDRHWRDLRTHTLHERRRDKLAVIGRAALTGQDPELGPQL